MQQERVQKALARMGFGSRREIERLIEQGEVRINGQLARPGDHVKAGDKINIGNRRAVIKSDVNRIRVLLYNKPEGEVCSRKDEKGRRSVFDSIGSLKDGRWISIGRLDINSSGLLLFTNYGELANHMMHPSSEIEREYAVRVNGAVSSDSIHQLLQGVDLDDGFMKFEQVIDAGGKGVNHWYHVILKEGKNREVRRLWQSQDVMVSRLIRIRYANQLLPRDLKPGKKRELTVDEVKALFDAVNLEWPAWREQARRDTGRKAGRMETRKSKMQADGRRATVKRAKSKTSATRRGRKTKSGRLT